jgi:hypothetical protein
MTNRQMISAHKIDIVIMMVLLRLLLHSKDNFPARVTALTELVRTARFQERQKAIEHGFSPFSAHLVARGGAPSRGAS